MKFVDKLKNIFFEEVPEDEDEEELPQTFAKKVEIPKKTVEIKKEEKPLVRPNITLEKEEEVEIEVPKLEEEQEEEVKEPAFPMMFDEEDFLEDKKMKEMDDTFSRTSQVKKEDDDREVYHDKKEVSYVQSVHKPTYTYTKSYHEEKESKGFKPSPIISPIYGILDKNYRKEEVVTKKETRITTGRTNFDLDTVRNKAFGSDDEEISDKKTREARAKEEKEDKKIYDVNNNKPQVKSVTLADADEYYNDLGLAYNVDYSDASRAANTRTTKYNNKDKKNKDVDDNLFDLIDSMYNKED